MGYFFFDLSLQVNLKFYELQCSIAENGKKLGFKEEENESIEISFIPLP